MKSNLSCMKGTTSSDFFSKRKHGGNGSLQSTPFKMMLALLLIALTLIQTSSAANRTVQRRGFKSSLLSTARGFGKRASMFERGIIPTTAIGFGKRSDPMQRRNDVFTKDLSSLSDLHAANQYYHLLQQLNEEASKNPQMIPVLLNALRMKEDTEYDELQ